ncbi:putative polyketide hydroxylase [Streptomyces sp. SAI-208]|uniref:FAD-dependent oxidoreductase n=1 Tax=unclassified Streptomyces TaxID=2593676 RepID=UPI0024733279|nr:MULTISPECIES: FAD-dependent monooxygenase [unclassified Streptomyces]MDH6517677.1 putative polyketide hydroxylase [Streptomyces sp. SAI-090]MDH6549900.1 putative polyketide hydroxylase [Streptomyces sp. SAI-041]MDH6586094.1 putative polyketide hydroxylase [Streptomyces sp. SAI-133]MDH6608537.1 putative polyketide hydroxylase [Streptomyces sp. SAI-208]MDH6618233.1 putative polyketide hydroxylase [Streptomyces sp. SAI-135]
MNQRAAQAGPATHRVPVLIVGGSLVGLSTSVFLGRLGVPHTLVERHAGTSIHPRGRGNNVRTMELFRTAGLEPMIRQAAATLADNHGILQTPTLVGDAGEWLFKEIDAGGGLARFSPSSWCLCSQNDLEPVLLDHAGRLGGDLRYATELLSFESDSSGVTAVLKSRETGEHTTVLADYLVAADGPRSPVREQLGIGQSGPGELFSNVSITFRSRRLADVVGERRFIVCYLTDPAADGALLPVDNRENWVFHAPWHPERGETLEEFTDERCVAHIRRAIGVADLDVEITGRAPWHAAQRVARSYRSGRVFLAGDSAHEMSPTGAFGSNTGIQDAHNLAWKLAAVLGGWAGEGLLDSYDAERRPVAEATSARAAARSAEHSHPGYAPAPGTGGGPQRGILNVALGYRYPQGAVVGADPAGPVVPDRLDLSGEPGSRAPHMAVRQQGERISTLDLYERSLVLLSGAGSASGWHEAAVRLAEETSVPLVSYRLGAGPHAELTPEDGTDWSAAHGTTPEGAVLVRPDGFVAWRSPGPVPDARSALRQVLKAVLKSL